MEEETLSLITVLGILGGIFWIGSHQPLQEECSIDEKIFSVSLTQRTEGSFFLGSGSVGDEPYYYFYKEAQDGLQGKILSNVSAEETSIQETDKMSPVYRKFGTRLKDCSDCYCYLSYKGTLFVPLDTVKLKFNADPENL